MKYLMLFVLLLIAGCGQATQSTPHPAPLSANELPIKCRWIQVLDRYYVIELEYDNEKHVFLQHYDHDNQSMVKVK